jgi:hypothetical protein
MKANVTLLTATRAALYLGVSTGRQAEHDLSIPDQMTPSASSSTCASSPRTASGWCRSRGSWATIRHK